MALLTLFLSITTIPKTGNKIQINEIDIKKVAAKSGCHFLFIKELIHLLKRT